MSWGMFGSESRGWSSALAGHHRAKPYGTRLLPAWTVWAVSGVLDMGRSQLAVDPPAGAAAYCRGDAAGAAGVNMAGPGVEAVIALRRALPCVNNPAPVESPPRWERP